MNTIVVGKFIKYINYTSTPVLGFFLLFGKLKNWLLIIVVKTTIFCLPSIQNNWKIEKLEITWSHILLNKLHITKRRFTGTGNYIIINLYFIILGTILSCNKRWICYSTCKQVLLFQCHIFCDTLVLFSIVA